MTIHDAIAVWDVLTAPILLAMVYTHKCPRSLVVGFTICAVGMLWQSYAVLGRLDQLNGWGLGWLLKDVGLGFLAVAMAYRAVWGKR